MKRKLLRFGKDFRVALGNRRSEAGEMVIPPGDAEGDPGNGKTLLRTLNFYVPPAYTKSGDTLPPGRR